jgi:NAD(P)H-dependent flavin oxidoreductase YrpB (nitropropane dioxygenase family)
MRLQNKLCKSLNINYPIIQAPMAGATSAELVAEFAAGLQEIMKK